MLYLSEGFYEAPLRGWFTYETFRNGLKILATVGSSKREIRGEMHRIELPVMTVRETLEPAGLNDVRQAAVAEVRRLLSETDSPDGDMTPFLLLGDHEGVQVLTPSLQDPEFFEEQLRFFVEEVGPLALSQRNAISAALVVTVWTVAGPAAAAGLRAVEHPDRQEAVTVMLANACGDEETMLANVRRHRFGPPTVDDFKTVSHGVQPYVAEAFRRGFAGLG